MTSPPLARLLDEWIGLREQAAGQHRAVLDHLAAIAAAWDKSLGRFAADVQAGHRRLGDDVTGLTTLTTALTADLAALAADLDAVRRALPADAPPAWQGVADAIRVSANRADAALTRHGLERIAPAVGDVYDPARHERVGTQAAPALPPGHVAAVLEPGTARVGGPPVKRACVLLSE